MKKVFLVCVVILLVMAGCCLNKKNIIIELEGNPTTGYNWDYEIDNQKIIKNLSDEYTPFENEGAQGVGGKYIFTFNAIKKGTVQIKFKYSRSWEKDIEPVYTITYTFKVDDDKKIVLISKEGTYFEEEIPMPVYK